MNVRQLRHVLALAEQRNFRRAAEFVGVTQPALTQSIQKLEREYGVTLFERSRREVNPTSFGVAVIQSARQTLRHLDNLDRELAMMKNLQAGRLIIGSDAWFSEALLGPSLARMLGNYPELRFSVMIGQRDNLLEDLAAGEIDLFIGPLLPDCDRRLTRYELTLPPLCLICNPDHPILELDEPTVLDCLAYPLAAPKLPSAYLDWFAGELGQPTTPDGRDIYRYFVESDDLGLIRRLVRTTETISAMLPVMIADEVELGLVSTIPLPALEFPLRAEIVHSASRPLAPAGAVLLEELIHEADSAREL